MHAYTKYCDLHKLILAIVRFDFSELKLAKLGSHQNYEITTKPKTPLHTNILFIWSASHAYTIDEISIQNNNQVNQ